MPVESGGEASAAVSVPADPSEGRQDLVILDWGEYLARPRGIQAGTILNYAGYDLRDQLPWDCPGESWFTDNIYEGLLYMYMNDPEDTRGCIAERWEHSDDYLTWTFQIRDGVKFHDGTVCDAYAVAKAWDYLQGEAPHYLTNYNIASWEAVNAGELVIRLSAPCAWFEAALAGELLYIASPTALELYGTDDNRAAVGTGPYSVESYMRRERIVLKANKDYYLEERMPCIETVNFIVLQGGYAGSFEALMNGEVDGMNMWFSFYEHYNPQSSGYDGHFVSCHGDTASVWFNANNVEAFKTYEVREAMCRFINFPEINERVFGGLGIVQDSLWAAGSPGYVPSDQYYYDPDEGLELLASVGLEPSDIEFHFVYSEGEVIKAALEYLMRAGVQMDLTPVRPEDSFIPKTDNNGLFLGSSYGFSAATPFMPWTFILEPDAIIRMCWQDAYDPGLYQKMLDEYDAMMGATAWEDMLDHSRQLTTYVQDDFGAFPAVQRPDFVALGRDFKNGIYFSERHDLQIYYLYQ